MGVYSADGLLFEDLIPSFMGHEWEDLDEGLENGMFNLCVHLVKILNHNVVANLISLCLD